MSYIDSILSYNKIKEIEECKPISPPSISSENFEQNEIFYYSFYLPSNYNIDQNNIKYTNKSYSSPSLFKISYKAKNITLSTAHLFSTEKLTSNREYKNSHKFIQSRIKEKINNNQIKNFNENSNSTTKSNYNCNNNIYLKDSGTKNEGKSCSIKYIEHNKDDVNKKDNIYNRINDNNNNYKTINNSDLNRIINNKNDTINTNTINNNNDIYCNKVIKKTNFIYQQKKATRNYNINKINTMKKMDSGINDDITLKNEGINRSKSNSKMIQNESKITVKSLEKNINNRVEFDSKNQNIHIYINNNIFNFQLNKNKNKNNDTKKNVKNRNTVNAENYINFSEKITSPSSLTGNKVIYNKNNKNVKNKDLCFNKNNINNNNNKIRIIQSINCCKNEKSKPIKIPIQIPIQMPMPINNNLKNIDNNTIYNESNRKINDINNKDTYINSNIKENLKTTHKLNISQLMKVFYSNQNKNKNGLFNIITFFDQKDIINLLETRNKKLRLLINKSIYDAYYLRIKENIKKYQEFLEVIRYSLVYSKVKGLLRIDLMLTIRFNNAKKKITSNSPLHFKLIYLYEYLKKIGKSDINKLYDCYGFDLFYENKNKKENEDIDNIQNKNDDDEFKGVYLSKQITNFRYDKNDELLNVQSILPFNIGDKGIFNIEIYSSNNYFINPSSIKIKLKSIDLNKNIKELNNKNLENIRINEYEYICKHWLKENELSHNKTNNIVFIKKIIKKWFEPYFKIKDIFFGNVGLSVYKFHLVANRIGILVNNNLNIKIIIKDSDDYVENEVKKNNLLFERNNSFEIRKGENIIFYLTMSEFKL